MKEYRLDSKKKKNNMTPFWVFVIVFTVIWLIGFSYSATQDDYSAGEYFLFLFPVFYVLIIGGILFFFFSHQIKDIKFRGDEVLLIRESGTIVYRGSDDISISETPNRFLLYIADNLYS